MFEQEREDAVLGLDRYRISKCENGWVLTVYPDRVEAKVQEVLEAIIHGSVQAGEIGSVFKSLAPDSGEEWKGDEVKADPAKRIDQTRDLIERSIRMRERHGEPRSFVFPHFSCVVSFLLKDEPEGQAVFTEEPKLPASE